MKNKYSIYFKIKRETPIIIYGAASAGLKGYHSLRVLNYYNVIGFMDKRSDEIKYQYGLPVWNIDSILPYNKKELLVVVCVKNVFEHKKIANQLIKNHYNNIIFKPIQIMKQETEVNYDAIDKNYNRIFNDANPNMKYDLEPIPLLENIEIYNYCDYAIISRNSDAVIANMPLSDIFVKMGNQEGFLQNEHCLCNVLALVPHIGLFKFFDGKDGDIGAYLRFCISSIQNSKKMYGDDGGTITVTDAWINNIIRNRSIVFDNMSVDVEIDSIFFINHVPSCCLDKQYIVMNSAKHRAAFFIVKGKKYMPITIASDEYEKLLNLTVLQELTDFLKTNKIQELNAPIQHPCVYKYPCKMANYYEMFINKVVFHIAEIFGWENNLKRFTVEDSIMDGGALSRCLSKIGFNVRRIIVDSTEKELCNILDKLFYVSGVEYVEQFKGADIICCRFKEIDRIENIKGAKMLIILSNDRYEFGNNAFKLIKKLFVTIWDNEIFSGYIYLNKKEKILIDNRLHIER